MASCVEPSRRKPTAAWVSAGALPGTRGQVLGMSKQTASLSAPSAIRSYGYATARRPSFRLTPVNVAVWPSALIASADVVKQSPRSQAGWVSLRTQSLSSADQAVFVLPSASPAKEIRLCGASKRTVSVIFSKVGDVTGFSGLQAAASRAAARMMYAVFFITRHR